MALTILSQPSNYQPVYTADGNNLSFVLNSTISQQCSMKYVADVYVRGDLVTTIKNSPNLEDGKCVIQIHEVLSDFISYDKWIGPNFQTCTQSFATYSVRFGEESDGSLDCSGTSFDTVYSGSTFSNTAFNGTIQYFDQTFNPVAYYVGPSYNNSSAKFLSNGPSTRSVGESDTPVLYYISSDEVLPGAGPSVSHGLEVTITSTTGATAIWNVLNGVASEAGSILAIAVGPQQINDYVDQGIVRLYHGTVATQSIIDCDTASYAVRITNYQTQVVMSEQITFINNCDCSRYTPFTITWLNKRGGFDTYTFRLKSTRIINNDKKEWSRFLSTLQPDDSFTYQIGDRGSSVYSSISFETATVLSEWQTEAEQVWTAEIFDSPEVYRVVNGPYYLPVVVGNKSVEIKNKKGYGDRLLSRTVEFTYSYEIVNQRG